MVAIQVKPGVWIIPVRVTATGPDSAVILAATGEEYAASGPEVARLLTAIRKTAITPESCEQIIKTYAEVPADAVDPELPW